MAFSIDIGTYKSYFDGGIKQYNFYTIIQMPNFSNVLKSTVRSGIADATLSIAEQIIKGWSSGVKTAAVTYGIDGNYRVRPFLVRSTTLPSSTIEESTSNWMGQSYKIGGQYAYSDWTVSFNVDKNADIIKDFYEWQRVIIDPETNKRGDPTDYMVNQELYLLNNDEPVCVYQLIDAWPKIINESTLDYSTNDMLQFDVTFAYQYHKVSDKKDGNLTSFVKTAVNDIFKTQLK